jgi:hypothetical protein
MAGAAGSSSASSGGPLRVLRPADGRSRYSCDRLDHAIVERAEDAAAARVEHLDEHAIAELQERRARRPMLELLERALLGEQLLPRLRS